MLKRYFRHGFFSARNFFFVSDSTSAFKDGWIDGDNLNDLFDTDVVGSVEKALPFREALFSLISSQNTSQPTAYDVDLFIPPNVMLSVQVGFCSKINSC